jgi:NADPH2:quinone reductase
MFAWTVSEYGHYGEVMRWCESEPPSPGPEESLLRVGAAGVSFSLILRIAGKYQNRDPLPFVPGTDVAGEVVAVGEGSKFKVGDGVIGVAARGAFSEQAVLPDEMSYLLPAEMSEVDGAAFLIAYQTSYIGLKYHGLLAEGETLLVHGAAGALGLAAVQIGGLMGARVIATASSAEKLAVCREQGAEHGIDYSKEDFVEAVQEITQGRGADVIYDPVGGDVFDNSRRCIAFRGRLVIVGFTSGRIPEIAANRLLLRNFAATGFTINGYRRHRPDLLDGSQEELFRMYREQGLRPVVSAVRPMSEFPQALEDLEQRRAIGKIVVVPE